MKCVVVVALFAFIAVQLCQSAPMPDEEKKEKDTTPPPHAAASEPPKVVEHSEVKETKTADPVAAVETPAKPEEKKP